MKNMLAASETYGVGTDTAARISICLNMIVKDEAQVIRRCLDSVRAFIDHWVIVDTGSSDGTQDIIRTHFSDIPGKLYERPWRDFGFNRTQALELARGKADYILIMDADNIFCAPEGWHWPLLNGDAYHLQLRSNVTVYAQNLLVADRLPWRWVGVLHEYLTTEAPHSVDTLTGAWIDRRHEGARSRDPNTFRKDAAILEAALLKEPENARYAFYLAQSWRDAAEPAKALEAYRHRATMAGWEEETWYALYQVAVLTEKLGGSMAEVRTAYLDAYQRRPSRAEPLYQLARYHRLRNEWSLAYLFARQATAIPRPSDLLFIDEGVYTWCSLDELGTAAYWVRAFPEGREAIERLLAQGHVPTSDRSRIESNLSLFPPTTVKGSTSDQHVQQHFQFKPPAIDQSAPKVLLAILAKKKEATLPFYLRCIEALDYPKSAIALYVRTNNNTDRTTELLRHWLERVGSAYASVEFDCSDVAAPVQQYGVHEWNETRFKVLGQIRQVSLQKAIDAACDFYFVADVDNFVRPNTLRDLVALNLPIVGPLLRHETPEKAYSNYHYEIDANGYFVDSEEYYWLLNQRIRGVAEVKVIHCTYLVRRDCLGALRYDDGSQRHEYVIFSASARAANIAQYLDTRQVYGYLTLDEDARRSQEFIGAEIDNALGKSRDPIRIVASMTTIPSRIEKIRPVIEAVLAQTVRVDHIELNIPYQCIRTGESYAVPEWLEGIDRVKIFRTDDDGPITKVAPTFLRYQNDHQTYIWSVDDDCAYPANQLDLLMRVHDPDKRRILTRYGGKLEADGTVSFWSGEADVTMLEGFGGVLYPPACIRDNFLEYVRMTSANIDCRRSDDIVLSMYFNACRLPIHLFNKPSKDTPWMVSGWLSHSKRDALSEHGHVEDYKRTFEFVNSPAVSSILMRLPPEELLSS